MHGPSEQQEIGYLNNGCVCVSCRVCVVCTVPPKHTSDDAVRGVPFGSWERDAVMCGCVLFKGANNGDYEAFWS